MVHAQLDPNGICIGYGNLSNIESQESLVYLPEGWSEDFLWRKWSNGWSSEKFEPVPIPQGTRLEERLQIAENTITALMTIAVNKGDLTSEEASVLLPTLEV